MLIQTYLNLNVFRQAYDQRSAMYWGKVAETNIKIFMGKGAKVFMKYVCTWVQKNVKQVSIFYFFGPSCSMKKKLASKRWNIYEVHVFLKQKNT